MTAQYTATKTPKHHQPHSRDCRPFPHVRPAAILGGSVPERNINLDSVEHEKDAVVE